MWKPTRSMFGVGEYTLDRDGQRVGLLSKERRGWRAFTLVGLRLSRQFNDLDQAKRWVEKIVSPSS